MRTGIKSHDFQQFNNLTEIQLVFNVKILSLINKTESHQIMKFLGFVLQSIIAVFLIYRGCFHQEWTHELNLALILGAPIMLMFGTAIKQNERSSNLPRGFFAMIKYLIVSYIVGVILAVIFFGIGIGLYHILDLRPAEGVGRY